MCAVCALATPYSICRPRQLPAFATSGPWCTPDSPFPGRYFFWTRTHQGLRACDVIDTDPACPPPLNIPHASPPLLSVSSIYFVFLLVKDAATDRRDRHPVVPGDIPALYHALEGSVVLLQVTDSSRTASLPIMLNIFSKTECALNVVSTRLPTSRKCCCFQPIISFCPPNNQFLLLPNLYVL